MDDDQLEYLKKLWKFETWRGRNALKESLFIWRYSIHGNEIPGWRLHSIRPMEMTGWPPLFQTMWTQLEDKTQALLNIDVFQCASRPSAHEFLMTLLGDFASPLIARRDLIEIGDVAFGGPNDFILLIARANIVLRVRSVGHPEVSVIEFARRIDRLLTSKVGEEKEEVVPQIVQFKLAAISQEVGVATPLEVVGRDPLERPLWYKFFSSTGEVMLDKGMPVYLPSSKGSQSLVVVATNPNRGSARKELRYTI